MAAVAAVDCVALERDVFLEEGDSMVFADVCRIYERNGKYLVLNPLIPSWIVTNINGVLLLKIYSEKKTFEKIADEFHNLAPYFSRKKIIKFLQNADEVRLFDTSVNFSPHKPYTLGGVYFNMTETCNLRCKYCFASDRKEKQLKMTMEDYERSIDIVKELNPQAELIFTGGEPLLSPLTINVARYGKRKGFKCKLLTNGTLINDGNVVVLMETFDTFKISLDGSTEEIHEYYRGIGTYQKTMNAVQSLLSKGADVTLAMVVTKHNYRDVNTMAEKWGSHLIFQPVFSLGTGRLHKELYLTGDEYYEALAGVGNDTIVPFSDLAGLIDRHKQNKSLLKCAMGDGEISISCSGDVYPCQLLHVEEYCVGNVIDQNLKEIYFSQKMNRFKQHTIYCIDKCKECDIRLLCGGSCQARHYSETGSIDKAGDFCSYEKRAIIDGLIYSADMQEL